MNGPRSVGIDDEIVAKESILQRPAFPGFVEQVGIGSERLALRDVHVEVAVVVVIEQRDTRRHDLRIVIMSGHPVEMGEGEACFRSAVDEPVRLRCCRGRGLGARGRGETEQQAGKAGCPAYPARPADPA